MGLAGVDWVWLLPLAVAALSWLLGAGWARRRVARRLRRQQRGAARAERQAEGLLESLGYRVLERQPTLDWTLKVDSERVVVALRADYLVSRGGQRYVAEVKSGELAPRLTTATTRRQLLEYRLAYDVHGCLLVDMTAGRVRQVSFETGAPLHSTPSKLAWMALGVALGAAATLRYLAL